MPIRENEYKALSIWQPWASAIALGIKRYETRHWKTSYRGPLLIHAAKTNEALRKGNGYDDLWQVLDTFPEWQYGNPPDTPLGALLAIGKLTDCIPTERLLEDIGLDMREAALGNFGDGRYGWQIEIVKLLPEPIPYKGAQGLFSVPADVLGVKHEQ